MSEVDTRGVVPSWGMPLAQGSAQLRLEDGPHVHGGGRRCALRGIAGRLGARQDGPLGPPL